MVSSRNGGSTTQYVVEMKKWVRGNPQQQVTYDGKTYYFPGEDQKKMFLADAAKYVPALGGDCTVCLVNMKRRVPGNIRKSALKDKRLFLFPGDEQKREFMANPDKYADADLALGGKCAVCRVEMNKDVPGKREIAAYYQGFRYLFPGDQQRQMFLANPSKYAVRGVAGAQASTASESTRLVAVRGKSGCAGCDHGIAPLGAPTELGLAINSPDGKIYVVEDAHKLYPKVYEHRFDGIPLELKGTVLKREGNVAWVQSSSMKVLN